MQRLIFENDYKMEKLPYKKSSTVVIDNGTFEIKAGYSSNINIRFENCFYKDTEGIKFTNTRNIKHKYTPFTMDLVSGFHVLEQNFDQIFEYLGVKECENLIITDAIYSPTRQDLIDFLFKVYRFKKIQVGVDDIYSYLYNTSEICTSLIIGIGHSSVTCYLLKNQKIADVYKINYGGKLALNYLSNIIRYKHKEYNFECSKLLKKLKCAIDYDSEVLKIVDNMRKQDYKDNIILLEDETEEDELEMSENDKEKKEKIMNRLKNMNKFRKYYINNSLLEEENKALQENIKLEKNPDDSEKEDFSESEDINLEMKNKKIKPGYKNEENFSENSSEHESIEKICSDDEIINSTNGSDEKEDNKNLLLQNEAKDSVNEENSTIEINKKSLVMKNNMYKIRLYQFNNRIIKLFKIFKNTIFENEENYERLTNLEFFLNKKKKKYEQIIRTIELREKCRKDSTNRKTYEFGLLMKTGELTEEEKMYKKKIKDSENLEIDKMLKEEANSVLEIIQKYDKNYLLSICSVLDLLTGKMLKKTLLNVDLYRVAEVLFEPSLVGSNQMGLGEIIEDVLTKYKDCNDIFITGGFSQIEGLKERIKYEAGKCREVCVRTAENPIDDSVRGACFSDIFQTFYYNEK